MDVLHFIKNQHLDLRARFSVLGRLEGVRARRQAVDEAALSLSTYLRLEREYLYPEISGLFPEADAVVAGGLGSSSVIIRRLKVLSKLVSQPQTEQGRLFQKRLEELNDAVFDHLLQEEKVLMPRLRTAMRTEEREDLGQVLMELQAEPAQVGDDASAPVPGRKRA